MKKTICIVSFFLLAIGSLTAQTIVDSVLYISEGTTTIKSQAYYGKTNFNKVVIPESVKKIGSLAFHSCSKLKEIEIPASVDTIGDAAFQNCTSLTKVTLHNGLKNLSYRLFKNTTIREISIPASVTEFESEIFASCDSLTTISVDRYSEAHAYYNTDARLAFTDNEPAQTKEQWLANATRDVIEDSVLYIKPGTTKIKGSAYYGRNDFNKVVIPSSVTQIDGMAFHSCTKLKEVDIPASVDTIGNAMFQNCTSLTKVTLHEGLTSIKYRMFKNTTIEEITIPSSVTSIGGEAFRDCNSLRQVNLTTNITEWGENAFLNDNPIVMNFTDTGERAIIEGKTCYTTENSKMTEIASALGIKTVFTSQFLELPTVETVADGQYKDYTMIEKISLGIYLTSIGDDAFPSSLKTLRNYNNPFVDEWATSHGWYLSKVTEFYREYSINAQLALPESELDYWSKKQLQFDDTEVAYPKIPKDTIYSISIPYRVKTNNVYNNNVEKQDYSGNISTVKLSYLAETKDHNLMLVNVGNAIIIEYFTPQFKKIETKTIALELPIFGGFFASVDGCYYVVEGQENPNDSDEVETFRFIKYDKDWNRIKALSLYGCYTSQPMRSSDLTMLEFDNHLFVRTAHLIYAGSDGVKHQTNMFFDINKTDMSLIYKQTGIAASYVQYVSHSFNQLHTIKNGFYAGVDHGDAYPRSIILGKNKFPMSQVKSGSYYSTTICKFPGEIGDNYTGAKVGGFSSSETHFLTAYTLIDTSNFSKNRTQNLYITATPDLPDGFGNHIHRQITNYSGKTESVRAPHLVKYGENDFILLWSRGDTVSYMHVDGEGNLGEQFSFEGNLSDCVPILYNGYITWYVTNGYTLDIYRIDVSDISKHEILALRKMPVNKLEEIVCMNSVESVRYYDYFEDYFPNVWKIVIDGSVLSIGSYAFHGSTNVTYVVVEDGVKTLEEGCFYKCSPDLVISIPRSVTSIGEDITSKSATWIVEQGSYAHKYALENNMTFRIKNGNENQTSVVEQIININIYAHNRTIVVENADDEIFVYDAMGRLICRDMACRVQTEIPMEKSGVYVVKVGNLAKKVIVE